VKLPDLASLAWRQLRERRLRTALTVLAVAVGVVVIIALSSQVEGVKVGIVSSLERLGPNTIVVFPTLRGSRMPVTDADIARLRGLEGVSKVIPLLMLKVRVSGFEDPVNVIAASSRDLADLLGELRIAEGGVYLDVPAPQVLVGHDLAFDTSTGEQVVRVGQPLVAMLGGRSLMLTAVGVLDTYGTSTAVSPDTSMFVPVEYVKQFIRGAGYNLVMVKAAAVDDVDQVSELLSYTLGGRARIVPVKQVASAVSSTIAQISLLLVGIAATSFIAAGLGTLNIMMVSVLERVREIGVLKALGMKDRHVMGLYILQGFMVGGLGSAAGVVIGVALSYLIPLATGGSMAMPPVPGRGVGKLGGFSALPYTPVINPLYVLTAVLISVAVTLVASVYPSWRASRLNPVEALRYE